MTDTFLLLYTEAPTRDVLARHRPGRLVLASDEITSADRAVYDECVQLPPPDDLAGTLAALRTVRADRVVAQTEYGLLPAALLGTVDPEAALLCTCKWLCRRALVRAGVAVPRHALVENVEQARAFVETYPVFLKPIASTLARGVVRVDRPDDLERQVARVRARLAELIDVRRCVAFASLARLDLGCDPLRQLLLEDAASGLPLETDGLVFDDRVRCFGTTEQVVSEPPWLALEGYMFPADGSDLTDQTLRALRACRVREMGFSVEFRGSTVIEVNGRLGEDDGFPELFASGLGTYPILDWITRNETVPEPRCRTAIAYRNDYRGGPLHADLRLRTDPHSSRAAYRSARAAL